MDNCSLNVQYKNGIITVFGKNEFDEIVSSFTMPMSNNVGIIADFIEKIKNLEPHCKISLDTDSNVEFELDKNILHIYIGDHNSYFKSIISFVINDKIINGLISLNNIIEEYKNSC